MEIILIIFVLLLISGCIWGFITEKKTWNNGFCSTCGTPWKYFDNDSQGGRGYKCDTCQKYMWLSWKFDRKEIL